MDVSKAKTVILILLIAFNAFLLANNLINNNAQGVSRETLENAEMILEQRGVTLECGIPVAAGGNHRLEYTIGGLDKASIVVRLLGEQYIVTDDSVYINNTKRVSFSEETGFVYTDSEPGSALRISEEAKTKEDVRRFMEDKGLLGGKYVFDKSRKNDDGSYVFYYIEKFEDQLLFDNFFIITLTDKGITRLEYSKYQIKEFSAESIEQTEVYQTLLAYFKEGSNVVITNIESGYKLTDRTSMDGAKSIEPLPVWRIMIKGEQEPIYISSYDISL